MQPKFYGAAAQYNKPSDSKLGAVLKIAGLVLLILVLITAGYYLVTALTSTNKNQAARLVAREKQLVSYISTYSKSITDDSLSTVSSNAYALATNDYYALQQGLKSSYSLSAVPDSITAEEADSTSESKLATAQSQNKFNEVYASLLKSKVTSAKTLALEVASNSSGKMKTAANTTAEHLTEISDQLTALGY